MQRRADRAAFDVEMRRDLVIGETVEVARDDDGALPIGQLAESGKEVGPVRRRVDRVVSLG